MMSQKKLSEYITGLGDECLSIRGNPDIGIAGVSDDSRRIRAGYMFCAVTGTREDGSKYLPEALSAGAVAVVAEKKPAELPASVTFLKVKDSHTAAGRLAETAFGYPARKLNVVGVTGTNGKTTCAELLKAIFEKDGTPTGMLGTVAYRLGNRKAIPADRTTPPPFQIQKYFDEMVEGGIRTAIVEASSHGLAQHRLGSMRIDAALFTNLSGDHLDYHGTMEKYYRAKSILFTEYLAANAPAVINTDCQYGLRLARELKQTRRDLKVLSFGQNQDAEVRITGCSASAAGSSFLLELPGMTLRLSSPMIGHHNIHNAAGAAALAAELGSEPKNISEAVRDFEGAAGRLQRVCPGNPGFAVFVDYAHTDDALRNVLAALRSLAPERILLVFGCGGERDRTKRPRMGKVAAELADRIYVTTDNPRSENPSHIIDEIFKGIPARANCFRITDRGTAIQKALADASEGDFVLLAGKGHETYQEIKGTQTQFDDVEEARNALKALGRTN